MTGLKIKNRWNNAAFVTLNEYLYDGFSAERVQIQTLQTNEKWVFVCSSKAALQSPVESLNEWHDMIIPYNKYKTSGNIQNLLELNNRR